MEQRRGSWPGLRRLRGHFQRHGHVAVPLPELAAARARELVLAVPALLGHEAHARALYELATSWAAVTGEGDRLAWGRRSPHDPRGGKCHVQTTDAFERYVAAEPGAPALLQAVLGRLRCFGAAAERLLDGCVVPVRITVRANVYDGDGGVPTHVDESALTVLFTDTPRSLLVGVGGRRAPLRPVDAEGWHAVLLPGEFVGQLLPRVTASPHAATPLGDGPRLSVSAFVSVGSPPPPRAHRTARRS